jgi:hypothetical protein
LQDIPVLQFNICDDKQLKDRYLDAQRHLIDRAVTISPGRYYGIPITPHPNPINPAMPVLSSNPKEQGPPSFEGCGHSHHLIEYYDSSDDSVRVQVLCTDYNNYQTAFRRKLKGGEWSGFFHTSDQVLPDFLKEGSEVLGISGAHDEM